VRLNATKRQRRTYHITHVDGYIKVLFLYVYILFIQIAIYIAPVLGQSLTRSVARTLFGGARATKGWKRVLGASPERDEQALFLVAGGQGP
jgi:hypothetical protein